MEILVILDGVVRLVKLERLVIPALQVTQVIQDRLALQVLQVLLGQELFGEEHGMKTMEHI